VVTTWVPEHDFESCVRVLDQKRLGSQRPEGLVILRAALGINRGYRNHPATRMWIGHERALAEYQIAACREWRRRGYKDGVLRQVVDIWLTLPGPTTLPEWWGVHDIHACHRRELVRRLPSHYGPIWPDVTATERNLTWPI
jgi:hypothetical protein